MTRNRTLWIIQWLLALIFLFAGVVKFILPADALTKQTPMLSAAFLRFIGTCEVLGALGLTLPGLLRIQPVMTPLAAAGLVIIMIGATVVTAITGNPTGALVPAIVGLMAGVVAYGRWPRDGLTIRARTADPTSLL